MHVSEVIETLVKTVNTKSSQINHIKREQVVPLRLQMAQTNVVLFEWKCRRNVHIQPQPP